MQGIRTIGILAGLALMAACGTTQTDRAVSGGAIGAAVGSAGAAATENDVATGAVLGGLLGLGVGLATAPENRERYGYGDYYRDYQAD